MRKISLFIATSIDGYIAKPNNDLSFLKLVEHEGEDYGYSSFIKDIDTIIVGRKTYDYVLEVIGDSHYDNGQRDVYVITRNKKPQIGRTIFYNDDIKRLVNQLKLQNGKNIYCDGGSEIIYELLKNNLIDELTISIIPIILGSGIKLFKEIPFEIPMKFVSSNEFKTGLIQIKYSRILNT